MAARGTLIGGKYRLNREIGEGAMGLVWEATHELTGREVAVKLMRKSTPETRHRLMREARACGKLRHRNIIEVLDVGEDADSGEPFLVMQLLHGETLQALLARQYRLSPWLTALIGHDIALALSTAHEHGIVHRDLKPANIFLHHEPGSAGYTLKVLDFGVSKLLFEAQSMATITGSMVGSLAYMSPEQVAARKDVDFTADIWSMGVMLFEMLVGRRPFLGAAQDVAQQILQGNIPKIRRFNRHIDPALEQLVTECLARNRSERLQSARELAFRLQPFLNAEQNPDRPSSANSIPVSRESKPSFARSSQISATSPFGAPDTDPLPDNHETGHNMSALESDSDTIATIPRGPAVMPAPKVFQPVKTTIKMKRSGTPAKFQPPQFAAFDEPAGAPSMSRVSLSGMSEMPSADNLLCEKTALSPKPAQPLPPSSDSGQIEVPPDRASTNGAAMLPVKGISQEKRRGLLMMCSVALMSGLLVCVAGLVAHRLWIRSKVLASSQSFSSQGSSRGEIPKHAVTAEDAASVEAILSASAATPVPSVSASAATPVPSANASASAATPVPSANASASAATPVPSANASASAVTPVPSANASATEVIDAPKATKPAPSLSLAPPEVLPLTSIPNKTSNTKPCDSKVGGCRSEASDQGKKPAPARAPSSSLPPIFELPNGDQNLVF